MCCALTAQLEMAQWCAVAERGRPFWCFPHERTETIRTSTMIAASPQANWLYFHVPVGFSAFALRSASVAGLDTLMRGAPPYAAFKRASYIGTDFVMNV